MAHSGIAEYTDSGSSGSPGAGSRLKTKYRVHGVVVSPRPSPSRIVSRRILHYMLVLPKSPPFLNPADSEGK
ncbi:hypothetical protein RvY_16100 [Ramazzottius varieornatus]|uniref:Uncharacterized protein n=1 Tax=Ramazzottius varieornatus TaxID=947166 RepID=A0A1D1W3U2_RAMVA|nr:hypothetical protein RvY_16100 [Ramazzottius varieornatus]